ncbi:MAG: type II toxin-antitoxin system RelE/ParE family toxin [Candidatus Omnitrophica bacterium]|nr:type II toxin-antitoxin system RelE/ParE family toxin [Candidatus Omnitrophota bacterium]
MIKKLNFVGSSQEDIKDFPEEVRLDIGYALFVAQRGEKSEAAKPLRGFGGAGVLEIVENFEGNTYRAVYTVKFSNALYVLHCFQKKSKHGIKTPQQDINLIKQRLRTVEEEYNIYYK